MSRATAGDVYFVSSLGRWGPLLAFLLAAVLIGVPFWADRALQRTLVELCYYLALAQMWNLLAGYTGLVSIGQQAFVGLGGYSLFLLCIYGGVPPVPAILLSGVLVALCAVPTALVVFRLRDAYFAIGTWVVAECYRLGFSQVTALGGGSGQSLPVAVVKSIGSGRAEREMIIYYCALALALGSVGGVYWLLRSRYGLALTAVRDSEPASGGLGVDVRRTRILVYVLAAFVTGLAGGLISLQKLRISPESAFSTQDWTAAVIFIVVIGGIGSIEGPILGTLIYFALREMFADYGTFYMIALGLVAVLMMLKAPRGVRGLLLERFDLHLFPVQRHLRLKDGDGDREDPPS